jgi:hypothetical protein
MSEPRPTVHVRACQCDDETRRILGELTILIDGIRLYLSKVVEGAPVLN